MLPLSAEDRVRKFQKTSEEGSRLRKASASNALSSSRPLPTPNTTSSAARARARVPLGPRERPQDFSKQR
jgi:dual specificity tyrosine-phosphorylation-regulated kinase 2/3/4